MAPPVLETERMVLRPLTLDDAPAIQRHFANWAIVQHLSLVVPWPYPDDGALTFLTEAVLPAYEAGSALTWGITERSDTADVIGCIDVRFEVSDLGNRGFWLAEHLWGQGLMTEAVVAVQDYVLLELGVDRLIVTNSIANPASRRIKEKTGARYLGEVEIPHHNGVSQSEKWEVTAARWAELRSS